MKVFGVDIVMKINHLQGQMVHDLIDFSFFEGDYDSVLKATNRSIEHSYWFRFLSFFCVFMKPGKCIANVGVKINLLISLCCWD